MDDKQEAWNQAVKTQFRPNMWRIMQEMRTTRGMSVHEVVVEVQLGTIFRYEEAKMKPVGSPENPDPRRLEYQQVAVLELIAELGGEMARSL